MLGCHIYFLCKNLDIKNTTPVTKAQHPKNIKNTLIENPAFLIKLASVVANL